MTTRSLIRALLLVGLGWLFLLGPGIASYWSILQNAGGYRRATFVVTGSHCIGGQIARDSRGGTSSSPRYCFLDGDVLVDGDSKGVAEELSIGSTLPADRPPGTRLPVFYNPAQPSFGINYLNQRVLPDEQGSDLATLARGWLWTATRMIQLALGTLLVVHIALRWGVRQLSRPRRQLAVDLGGGAATPGAVLLSQGVTLLLGQIPGPAWGGVVLGLVLAGAGAPLLIRRFAVFSKDAGRMARGRQLLGVVIAQEQRVLPSVGKVVLQRERGRVTVALDGPAGIDPLGAPDTHETARQVGVALAAYFGVELDDRVPFESQRLTAIAARRRVRAVRWRGRLAWLAVPLAGVGAATLAVEQLPGLGLSVSTAVLEPFGPARQVSFVRRWALDRLARDASDLALQELLRLLNTIDAQAFPEIARDVDSAATRATGLGESLGGKDRETIITAVNERAARRLGGTLDENGGILGLLPVTGRFVGPIDTIASADPTAAWLAWSHLGAGELTTPEQFLWAVGPALCDPRPIRFAIVRNGASFEGQPEPIGSCPETLAQTVGEALALRLWLMAGVGDDLFPEDFWAWWKQWAREHRLPPPARPEVPPPDAGQR